MLQPVREGRLTHPPHGAQQLPEYTCVLKCVSVHASLKILMGQYKIQEPSLIFWSVGQTNRDKFQEQECIHVWFQPLKKKLSCWIDYFERFVLVGCLCNRRFWVFVCDKRSSLLFTEWHKACTSNLEQMVCDFDICCKLATRNKKRKLKPTRSGKEEGALRYLSASFVVLQFVIHGRVIAFTFSRCPRSVLLLWSMIVVCVSHAVNFYVANPLELAYAVGWGRSSCTHVGATHGTKKSLRGWEQKRNRSFWDEKKILPIKTILLIKNSWLNKKTRRGKKRAKFKLGSCRGWHSTSKSSLIHLNERIGSGVVSRGLSPKRKTVNISSEIWHACGRVHDFGHFVRSWRIEVYEAVWLQCPVAWILIQRGYQIVLAILSAQDHPHAMNELWLWVHEQSWWETFLCLSLAACLFFINQAFLGFKSKTWGTVGLFFRFRCCPYLDCNRGLDLWKLAASLGCCKKGEKAMQLVVENALPWYGNVTARTRANKREVLMVQERKKGTVCARIFFSYVTLQVLMNRDLLFGHSASCFVARKPDHLRLHFPNFF